MAPCERAGTRQVQAAGVGLAVGPHERLAAHGTVLRERPGLAALRAVGEHGAEHLGDDVAGPADDDRVTRAHVLGPHLVLVVEGGLPDGDPAHEHRLEHRERRGPAGAPDRHHDVEQLGGALLRRELVGDGPPRRLRGGAEVGPTGQVVDLHDHAVDLVGEVVPLGLPLAAVGVHLVEAGERADLRVHRETKVAEEVERLVVGGEGGTALDLAELVASTATARGWP